MKQRLVKLMLLVVLSVLSGCANKDGKQNELYVSVDGNDHNEGTLLKPLRTIQKAIDKTESGGAIIVREGTYYESVVIKKSGRKRNRIELKGYKKERPVLDGSHMTLGDDDEENGLISVINQSYILIKGFDLKNLTTTTEAVPSGIRISGSGKDIQIINCRISNIKVDYEKVSKEKANAHGIAFYGTENRALKNIVIKDNEVFNNQLGQSEAVVLNGNINQFEINHNKVHHNDNIGIDLIGFENVASKNDQVRNGTVTNNQVWQISSEKNPAYEGEKSAGGIYIDGAKRIVIEHNQVWQNDIGIEIASEHKGKTTSDIILLKNEITENQGLAGIAFGGYDKDKGHAKNIKIEDNFLENNVVDILVQFNAQYKSNEIKNNQLLSDEVFSGDFTHIIKINNKINAH